jgi:hypothetical protein
METGPGLHHALNILQYEADINCMEETGVETQQIESAHNYNNTVEVVYRFLVNNFSGKKIGRSFTEPDFEISKQSLRVFTDEQIEEIKKTTPDEVLKRFVQEKKELREKYISAKVEQVKEFREKDGSTLAIVTGATVPSVNDVQVTCISMNKKPSFVLERWILSRTKVHDQVPLLLYRSYEPQPQKVVLLAHHEGKSYFINPDGTLNSAVQNLMQKGYAIAMIDLFMTGEHQSPWEKVTREETSSFLDTFLNTQPAEQVQDIITSLVWLSSRRDLESPITLVGMGNAEWLSVCRCTLRQSESHLCRL